MSTDPIHVEYRDTLFGPPPEDCHELIKIASVGSSWFVGTCSCGWKSKIKPARWRVEQQHRDHRRHQRTEWASWK